MSTKSSNSLSGIYPSFLTPLRSDETLDFDGVDREVDYLLQADVHGLWLAGTGGEIFGISENTLRQMVQRVTERVDGRVPIMANISACATGLSTDRAQYYADCGVNVATCTPPFYFSYTVSSGKLPRLYRCRQKVWKILVKEIYR
jgi:dihydrodipicolinate synthase/N-acetylneuraminate lyase